MRVQQMWRGGSIGCADACIGTLRPRGVSLLSVAQCQPRLRGNSSRRSPTPETPRSFMKHPASLHISQRSRAATIISFKKRRNGQRVIHPVLAPGSYLSKSAPPVH